MGPPAVIIAGVAALIVNLTGTLEVLSQPVAVFLLAAKKVIVPSLLRVGLPTIVPPLAASYQTTVCPGGTVAVAVNVGIGFGGQTVVV